jgi:hypothetical protein
LKEGKLTDRGNPGKLEGTVVKRVRGEKSQYSLKCFSPQGWRF